MRARVEGCAAHGDCARIPDPGPDGEEGTADDTVHVEHDTTYAACIGEAICDEAAVNAGAECDEDADCIGRVVCASGPNAGATCTGNDGCAHGECERSSAPCVLVSPAGYFTSYQCLISTEASITRWEGPGCHPPSVGFPSACDCQTDADCAAAEICGGGRCESYACNSLCQIEGRVRLLDCGDGRVQAGLGEVCDDGNQDNGDGCDPNCTPTGCGNGIVTAGEQCDDGNHDPGDGCEADCTRTGASLSAPNPTKTRPFPTLTPTRPAELSRQPPPRSAPAPRRFWSATAAGATWLPLMSWRAW